MLVEVAVTPKNLKSIQNLQKQQRPVNLPKMDLESTWE